jgi:hypothetical protein
VETSGLICFIVSNIAIPNGKPIKNFYDLTETTGASI